MELPSFLRTSEVTRRQSFAFRLCSSHVAVKLRRLQFGLDPFDRKVDLRRWTRVIQWDFIQVVSPLHTQ